jgi:RecB family exonuclease
LPTGETLNICGTMDRVDVNEDGNLAMVIDYKLEGQQRWIEVDNGGSLQMPLYAMALKELFGIANIIPAYDSLSRGARDRLLSLEIPAPQRAQFARPLAGEDSRSIKTMGIPQFNQWLLFTKKTVARLAMQLKQAQITPRPGDHCNHCSYGDLCRVDRFGRHDGEPLNATPFD